PGSGVGLVGMRERVELLGGQLEAGPYRDPEGTELWLVRGELPVEESARQRPPRCPRGCQVRFRSPPGAAGSPRAAAARGRGSPVVWPGSAARSVVGGSR